MTGNQGNAVCVQNNDAQDKSRNAVQHSLKKDAQSENDRALNLRRRILDVFNG